MYVDYIKIRFKLLKNGAKNDTKIMCYLKL